MEEIIKQIESVITKHNNRMLELEKKYGLDHDFLKITRADYGSLDINDLKKELDRVITLAGPTPRPVVKKSC